MAFGFWPHRSELSCTMHVVCTSCASVCVRAQRRGANRCCVGAWGPGPSQKQCTVRTAGRDCWLAAFLGDQTAFVFVALAGQSSVGIPHEGTLSPWSGYCRSRAWEERCPWRVAGGCVYLIANMMKESSPKLFSNSTEVSG